MRGGFRGGMFRFGCGSAYGGHSNTAFPIDNLKSVDGNEYRSYLYATTAQASMPRQKADNMVPSNENEIFPGVRVGEQSFDVAVVVVGFGIIFVVTIGACFLLGWISNWGSAARAQTMPMAAATPMQVHCAPHQYQYQYYVLPTTAVVHSTAPQYQYAPPVSVRTTDGAMVSRFGRPIKVDW